MVLDIEMAPVEELTVPVYTVDPPLNVAVIVDPPVQLNTQVAVFSGQDPPALTLVMAVVVALLPSSEAMW